MALEVRRDEQESGGALGAQQEALVRIVYTNYRGETSLRHVVPRELWFGDSEWHDGRQWFLTALDVDRGVERSFALKDVRCWLDD